METTPEEATPVPVEEATPVPAEEAMLAQEEEEATPAEAAVEVADRRIEIPRVPPHPDAPGTDSSDQVE